MAIPILNHLDLRSVSELQNALLHTTTHTAATNKVGAIIYDTGSDTLKYCTGTNNSDWISLVGDTNTWRTVTAGGNTLSTSETLAFTAGTNIAITESAGAVTITGTDTNTQNIFTSSWVDSSADVLLRLTKSGASSGTQDIKLVAGTNVTLTPSGANMTIASTDTNTQLSTEQVQDIVGAMVTSNTETRIAVTYQDGDGTLDFVVEDQSTDIDVNVANLTARLAQVTENVTIGDAADVTVIIPGDLQVTGTTTTNNVETVSTTNGVVFEGHAADAYEGTLKGGTYTADRTYTLPDSTGVVNIGYSTTVGGATSIEVTHSLNSRAVIVQLFDTSSFETVVADVVRTTVDTIDLTFAVAPSAGDITVLVTRVA